MTFSECFPCQNCFVFRYGSHDTAICMGCASLFKLIPERLRRRCPSHEKRDGKQSRWDNPFQVTRSSDRSLKRCISFQMPLLASFVDQPALATDPCSRAHALHHFEEGNDARNRWISRSQCSRSWLTRQIIAWPTSGRRSVSRTYVHMLSRACQWRLTPRFGVGIRVKTPRAPTQVTGTSSPSLLSLLSPPPTSPPPPPGVFPQICVAIAV